MAQKELARGIITFLHGEEEYIKAEKISKALFSGDIQNLSEQEISDAFKGVVSFDVIKNISVMDMLVDNKIASSKREAREFLTAGSISINGIKYQDLEGIVDDSMLLYGKYLIVRKGKKKYFVGLVK